MYSYRGWIEARTLVLGSSRCLRAANAGSLKPYTEADQFGPCLAEPWKKFLHVYCLLVLWDIQFVTTSLIFVSLVPEVGLSMNVSTQSCAYSFMRVAQVSCGHYFQCRVSCLMWKGKMVIYSFLISKVLCAALLQSQVRKGASPCCETNKHII